MTVIYQPCKMLERPVPFLFSIAGKAASGQLPALKVVADAFTADSFARAGFIAAITGF